VSTKGISATAACPPAGLSLSQPLSTWLRVGL
jgi:hypothetical protein